MPDTDPDYKGILEEMQKEGYRSTTSVQGHYVILSNLPSAPHGLYDVAVSPDGKLVASVGWDREVWIDECYRLVGLIKLRWEGISGGTGPEDAIAEFFAGVREKAT